MRDSGVEWLGEVPAHWEECPLGALFGLKHGYPFDSSRFDDSGDFILMTPGNFNERGGFRDKIPEKFYRGSDFPDEFVLKTSELLVAMTEQGPGLLGSALFVPAEGTYLHNQRLGLVQELRTERVSARYLFHLFNSGRYRAEIGSHVTGSTVRHTSPKKIRSVKIWLPTLGEQEQIARFLDGRLVKFDALEEKAEETILLLQERRTALISAAVTGKIDVRGWKAPRNGSGGRMSADAKEAAFQQDIIDQMVEGGWKSATPPIRPRAGALHLGLPRIRQDDPAEDLGEVQEALPEQPRAGVHRQARRSARQGRPAGIRQEPAHLRHPGRAAPRAARQVCLLQALPVQARSRPEPRDAGHVRGQHPARGARAGLQPLRDRSPL